MSTTPKLGSKKEFVSLMRNVSFTANIGANESEENNENEEDDNKSITECGAISILGTSRSSLKYRSASNLNASRRSIYKIKEEGTNLKLLEEQKKLGSSLENNNEFDNAVHLTFWQHLESYVNNYKGYLFSILSALCFSLSHMIMRRAKWLSGSDHAFIRYSITFVFMFIYMKYSKVKFFPKNRLTILFLRGFIGSIALISSYFAVMFTNPSDVVTIIHTSIVITAIISRIFFKEKLTLAHLVAVILSFIGVILISKPAFLFPNKTANLESSLSNSTNLTLNLLNCKENQSNGSSDCSNANVTSLSSSYRVYIGIALSFFSSYAVSVVFCLIKKLNNSKVHWATSSIFVCWFGIPFAFIICTCLIHLKMSHQNLELERKDLPMDIFYSSISACISLSGQIFVNISLKYEEATKVAIVKTIDVFFSAVLQYFMLNITMDLFNIMGAVSILTGTGFVLVYKMMENKYEAHKEDKTKAKLENEAKNNQSQFPIIEDSTEATALDENNKKTADANENLSFKNLILKLIFIKI